MSILEIVFLPLTVFNLLIILQSHIFSKVYENQLHLTKVDRNQDRLQMLKRKNIHNSFHLIYEMFIIVSHNIEDLTYILPWPWVPYHLTGENGSEFSELDGEHH